MDPRRVVDPSRPAIGDEIVEVVAVARKHKRLQVRETIAADRILSTTALPARWRLTRMLAQFLA